MQPPPAAVGVESHAPPDRAPSLVVAGVAALAILPVVSWLVQGVLWRLGVPGPILRIGVGGLPDLVAAVVVGVGLAAAWRARQRPDALDWAVVALVAVVVAYFVVDLVGRLVGSDPFPLAPSRLYLHGLAVRTGLGGFLLLAAARAVRPSPEAIRRLLDVVLTTGSVLAIGALVESLLPNLWESFGDEVLDLRALQHDVYGVATPEVIVVRTPVAGRDLVRAGSLLFENLQLGFLLLPALTLAMVRAVRAPRAGTIAVLVIVAGGAFATLGRASIAAAFVACGVVAATRDDRAQRRRLFAVGAAMAVFLVAVAVPTGLADRVVATVDPADTSTGVHRSSTSAAIDLLGDHPLGIGLGTGFAASGRGSDGTNLVTENAYLDQAIQTGVLGGVVLVVTVGLLLVALGRRAGAGDLPVVALASVAGLAAGGLVLHTWQMIETSWLVLGLAGLALPRGR